MEAVRYRIGSEVVAVEVEHADTLARRTPTAPFAVATFERLATDSDQLVDLTSKPDARDAARAISDVYSDGWGSRGVSALREMLGAHLTP